MFDPSLFDGSQGMEIIRWMQVGLLCIQDNRADRPTIADVLEMLNGKEELPTPKIAHGKSDTEKSDEEVSAWSDGSLSPMSPSSLSCTTPLP